MRRILLAATCLGALLALPGAAGAGCFGRTCGLTFGAPISPYVYPYAYPYPYYAPPVYYPPVVYGPSYFRPEAPYAWNALRNWRDTWEDDGVKVHGYTLR
jgi:hypothetical protein